MATPLPINISSSAGGSRGKTGGVFGGAGASTGPFVVGSGSATATRPSGGGDANSGGAAGAGGSVGLDMTQLALIGGVAIVAITVLGGRRK